MKKYEEAEHWRQGRKTVSYYEEAIEKTKNGPQRHAELMEVIKPDDMPWEICKQGKLKHVIHEKMHAISKTMNAYIQEIPPGSKSGKHRHMAEEVLFVLEGQGYDLHWDVDLHLTDRYEWVVAEEPKRFDWEVGDVITIPVNTVHQHFNSDPHNPARLLSASSTVYETLDCDDLEQLEDAPEFESK